jgi:hypothetical protein
MPGFTFPDAYCCGFSNRRTPDQRTLLAFSLEMGLPLRAGNSTSVAELL